MRRVQEGVGGAYPRERVLPRRAPDEPRVDAKRARLRLEPPAFGPVSDDDHPQATARTRLPRGVLERAVEPLPGHETPCAYEEGAGTLPGAEGGAPGTDVEHLDGRRRDAGHPGEARGIGRTEHGRELVVERRGHEAPGRHVGQEEPHDCVPSGGREAPERAHVGAVRHDLERDTAATRARDGERGRYRPVGDHPVEARERAEQRARAEPPADDGTEEPRARADARRDAGPSERVPAIEAPDGDPGGVDRRRPRAVGCGVRRADAGRDDDDLGVPRQVARLRLHEMARRVALERGVARGDDGDPGHGRELSRNARRPEGE